MRTQGLDIQLVMDHKGLRLARRAVSPEFPANQGLPDAQGNQGNPECLVCQVYPENRPHKLVKC